MHLARWVSVVLAVSILFFWLIGQWAAGASQQWRFSRVPARLAPSEVVYSSVGNGVGPGAKEGAIAAYVWPSQTIAQLQEQGLDYFDGLDTEWHRTPLGLDDNALRKTPARQPDIHGFTQSCVSVELDPEIQQRLGDSRNLLSICARRPRGHHRGSLCRLCIPGLYRVTKN